MITHVSHRQLGLYTKRKHEAHSAILYILLRRFKPARAKLDRRHTTLYQLASLTEHVNVTAVL